MVDTSSMPLGSVTVEVKASLSKLVSDFAAARVQSQAFANDMARAVGPTNATAAATANLAKQFNGVANQYEPLRSIQQKYASDLAVVNGAEAAGIVASTEATALRGRMAASFAVLEEETSKSGKSLTGWAREVEHNIRGLRLLIAFVGVDVALRFGEFAVKTLEATAAIKDQAEALGLTTDQLQEYRAIAGQVGMSTDEMDKAFVTFRKNLDDMAAGRVSTFSKMLKTMGISIHDAGGAVKPTNQLFLEMLDSLNRVGNAAQQRAGAVVAFGEAGNKAGELIRQGSSGVEKLMEAAKALGLVLSNDQIQQADVTAKKLDTLWQVLKIDFSKTVVDNAQAIQQISTALEGLAAGAIGNAVKSIGQLIQRFEDLGTAAREALGLLNDLTFDNGSSARGAGLVQKFAEIGYDYKTGALSGTDAYGNYYTTKPPESSTKGLGKVAGGMGGTGTPSNTVSLSEATRGPPKPPGPNIDLSHLLSPKGKGAPKAKFDEFEKEMDAEMAEYLQLQEQATGDIEEQNRLAKEVIDLKIKEKNQDIKRQVKRGELTDKEGKQLIHQNAINASAEKEAEDRKTELERIQLQAKYADEIMKLNEDRLNTEKQLARTNDKRKEIDAELLDSKQQQAVSALQEQIDEAAAKNDTNRVAQLTGELAKLRANQLMEWQAFNVEHLTGIEKFRNDLPATVQEINDQLDKIRFDQFTERLQRAADMAKSIGDAFGQFFGDLASFKNPLDALKSLLGSLAQTMTQNVIVKPISDWATQHIGVPLAKQAFGKSMTSGPDALTPKQFDMALAQATGTLGGFERALPGASSGIGSITTAATPASTSLNTLASAAQSAAAALESISASAGAGGGGGGGGLGGLGGISSLFGGGGGGAGTVLGASGLGDTFDVTSGLDLGSMFDAGTLLDMSSMGIGYDTGGFTGSGADHEPAGVVHKNEFVMSSGAVSQYGLPMLGAMNTGDAPILRAGGGPGPRAAAAGPADMNDAAAMLMQAAQMLMQASQGMMGGGKGGGGILSGLLGIATGALLGGKGGGIGKALGGLFGGGGGGVVDLTGPAFASQIGHFSSGGFTGSGADHEPAGIVHKNEWVWDADTTRRFMPLLAMIGSGRMPSYQGPGLGQTKGRGEDSRPQVIQFGDIHLHGVADERTARQSANQFMGHVQQRTAQVTRRGLNK